MSKSKTIRTDLFELIVVRRSVVEGKKISHQLHVMSTVTQFLMISE